MITQQVEEEVVGRHDTVYLSFEVPSIPATESKSSYGEATGPMLQEAIMMDADLSPEDKPLVEEAAAPTTTANEEPKPITDEVKECTTSALDE